VCLLVIYLGEVEKFGKTKFGTKEEDNGRKKPMAFQVEMS